MSEIPYKIIERKQKLMTKVYAVVLAVLVLFAGFYFYGQWQQYSFAKTGIADGGNLSASLDQKALDEKANYEGVKKDFEELDEEVFDKLETIFPAGDAYTEVTRQMDEIELVLAKKHNPFEIANISFQNVIEMEEFNVLPVRMNIRSSDNNFTRFLHMIENSGGLDDDFRLMDISSIRLNFENAREQDGKDDLINFAVQINAYFQK